MDILSKTISIQPEHTGAFLRLKKLLNHAKGFQLLIIDYNNISYRDFIINSLNNKNYDTSMIDSLQSKDFFYLEQTLTNTTSTHNKTVSHIINLELNAQANTIYTGFNYHRERIANNYPHTLILWLSQSAIQQMSEQAIDFWSWREQVFDFFIKPDINKFTSTLTQNTLTAQNADLSKKAQRKQEILEYLNNQNKKINFNLSIDLYQELAHIDMLMGKYDDSFKNLEQAKLLADKIDDKLSYYLVLKDESNLFYLQGEYQKSLELLTTKVLPNLELLNMPLDVASTQSSIGTILIHQGEYKKALNILQKESLPIYKKLNDTHSIAMIQSKISSIFTIQNNYQNALDLLANDVLPIYEKLNNKREIALTKGRIANILTHQGFYDKALYITKNEELPIYEQLGEIRSIAIAEGKIADIYMLHGDFQSALKIILEKEIPIYTQLGDARELAVAQGKVADIYIYYGKYEEALKIINTEEIPVYEKLKELNNITISKTKIVRILTLQSNFEKALSIIKNDILPNCEKLKNMKDIAYAKGQFADILTKLKRYDQALVIRINEEVPTYIDINARHYLAVTYCKIAQLYHLQKKYDNAINIYERQAIPLLENLGDLASLTHAKLHLALTYLERNPQRGKKKVNALLRWCYKTAYELQLPDLENIQQTMLRVGIKP